MATQLTDLPEQVQKGLKAAEERWVASQRSEADRLSACTDVAAILLLVFSRDERVSAFAQERIYDLMLALGELNSGRHSDLLQPAKRPSNTPSEADLAQQGLAFACVQVLRSAGASAGEARNAVARQFRTSGFAKFGEAKLRHLGTRMTGPSRQQDPAYEYFVKFVLMIGEEIHQRYPLGATLEQVRALTAEIIALMRLQDHRA